MKRIVVFPGQMDLVYIQKEMSYLVERFDETIIFTYPGNILNYNRIAKKYEVVYKVIKNFTLKSILASLNPFVYIKLGIIHELKKIIKKSKGIKNIMKSLSFVFLYVNFAINAECEYKKLNTGNYEDYLYAYWFSRNAFACAYINHVNADQNIVKAVTRAHRNDLYENTREENYIPFRKYIYQHISDLFFVSANGRDYFERKYNVYNKLHVSYLGIPKSKYIKYVKRKRKICIASCSDISKVKRIDLIIDSLARINLPIEYIHIGDGTELEFYKKYARHTFLNEISFHFLGKVPNSDLGKVYEKFDVDFLINLSDSEGIPVSIMEAFSFGIPAIAREVGGNAEIVNGNNGLLLKENEALDIDRMAFCITKFIKCRLFNIEKYNEYCSEAYKTWQTSFNAEINYTNFINEIIL